MAKYTFFLASALEKVFPDCRPQAMKPGQPLSVWRGSRAAVQLVYQADEMGGGMPQQRFRVEVRGAPVQATMRRVELSPSDFVCYENSDQHYITKDPGLFPDLLRPLETPEVLPLPRQYRSLWLSWDIPEEAAPGDYRVEIAAREVTPSGEEIWGSGKAYTCTFLLRVGAARLPEQSLIHTEWFHTDNIAEYYGLAVFSEEYWRITENFIRAAAEHGINMLLTPVFTPPLDTAVGAERLTVQLVDVIREKGAYRFDFQKLARWVGLCRKHGISYLEIPHLFTQWGAAATPKIMATVEGVEKRIFGWDVPAESPEYRRFLEAFLPSLRSCLDRLGYDRDHVYYHISDEPGAGQLQTYRTAKAQVEDLLADCRCLDALSSLDFYKQGLVQIPVCASDHIQPFFDAGVPELWTYYCCAQGNLVPNRFFSMESARNRIMGVLMYLYDVKGFLHWGFNFYSSKFSLHPINPFLVSHGDYGFPSGDPFLVYPGEGGEVWSSIRAEVQDDALLDLRALQKLEELADRKTVETLIYKTARMRTMTFTDYPRDADFLLDLREKIAREIEKREAEA